MNPRDEVEAVCAHIRAKALKQRCRAFSHFTLGLFWLGWAACAFVIAWKLWQLKP